MFSGKTLTTLLLALALAFELSLLPEPVDECCEEPELALELAVAEAEPLALPEPMLMTLLLALALALALELLLLTLTKAVEDLTTVGVCEEPLLATAVEPAEAEAEPLALPEPMLMTLLLALALALALELLFVTEVVEVPYALATPKPADKLTTKMAIIDKIILFILSPIIILLAFDLRRFFAHEALISFI